MLAQRLQLAPAPVFQLMRLATVIWYWVAMVAQVSPDLTKWKVLQLPTMPVWVGVGVVTPLPVLVVVVFRVVVVGLEGVWPTMEMQAYAFAHNPVQVVPAFGFQVMNCCRVIP